MNKDSTQATWSYPQNKKTGQTLGPLRTQPGGAGAVVSRPTCVLGMSSSMWPCAKTSGAKPHVTEGRRSTYTPRLGLA